MPGVDGLEALTQIVATASTTRVLMLTTFDLDEYVYRAMRAGASGFLLKDMPGEDIAAAVRQVARGADALLAPALTRRLVDRFASSRPRASTSALDRLTARELDVLRLVARGLSNAEIAAELFVGETTVKTHVARILMKLGLRDRVQAVVVAHEAGLGKARWGLSSAGAPASNWGAVTLAGATFGACPCRLAAAGGRPGARPGVECGTSRWLGLRVPPVSAALGCAVVRCPGEPWSRTGLRG